MSDIAGWVILGFIVLIFVALIIASYTDHKHTKNQAEKERKHMQDLQSEFHNTAYSLEERLRWMQKVWFTTGVPKEPFDEISKRLFGDDRILKETQNYMAAMVGIHYATLDKIDALEQRIKKLEKKRTTK